jgi:hypothetical protein
MHMHMHAQCPFFCRSSSFLSGIAYYAQNAAGKLWKLSFPPFFFLSKADASILYANKVISC